MFTFGSGRLYVQTAHTTSTASVLNGHYQRIGVAALQDGSLDFSTEIKSLYGANRYPVAVAQGKGKISITAKYADWNAGVMAMLLNHTKATGGRNMAVNVVANVPHASTFTVSADAGTNMAPTPGSGVWFRDVQVVFLDTAGSGGTGSVDAVHHVPGYVYQQVAAGAESAGKYSVAATGVYTFHSDDKDCRFRITYVYTITTGFQLNDGTLNQWSNVAMGQGTAFRGIFQGLYGGQQTLVELAFIVPAGFKSATKLDDFTMNDTNFEAFADPDTDEVGQISLVQ